MPYVFHFSWRFAQLESFSAFFFLKFHSFLVINENFVAEVGCLGCDLQKHTYPKSITLSFEKYIGLDLTCYLYLLLLFHCVQDAWKKLKEVGIVFVQCRRGFSLSQQGKKSWAAQVVVAGLHVRAYSHGSGPGSRQNRDRVRVQVNFKSPSLVTYFQHPGWPTYLKFIATKIATPKHEHIEDSSHSNNNKPNFNVFPIWNVQDSFGSLVYFLID